MRINDEEFLRYYWEELLYLRRVGKSFANTFPKIAARLELQGDECPDPHVERLIESFAFLTARIQRNLDQDFPEVAAEMLNVLYPHFLQPIPSMAIARFDLDPDRGKLTSGFTVPRHTKLWAQASDGKVCRWRTSSATTLWPIEVTEAKLDSPHRHEFLENRTDVAGVLRIRLKTRSEPLETLEIDRLRFHLDGDSILIDKVYELLLHGTVGVAVLPKGAKRPTAMLPASSIAAVGFTDDEAILPYPVHSHPSYRLVQEFFAFPDKFHFVDVSLAGAIRGEKVEEIDLLFLLDDVPRTGLHHFSADTFVLNCAPIINLFKKTTEPIRVDHRRLEYRLVPEMGMDKSMEVHSILSVSGTANPDEKVRDYAPYYAWSHELGRRVQRTFWHARRVLSLYDDVVGTEMLLSFVDLDFRPDHPPEETVWAHTLCTNRTLAAELPAHRPLLHTDGAPPVSGIVCLKKPTQPVAPPVGGQALWRLISHLSLNYLSVTDNREAVQALKNILRLYAPKDASAFEEIIKGVVDVNTRQVMRRFGDGTLRSWRRGTEVAVTLDGDQYVGSSAYLFASVLNRFFALWASTNSFTQLVVRTKQREGEWKRWPPMAGNRPAL